MSLKFAACNLARGLSDESRHQTIANGIRELDADVIVLSEAFDRTGQPVDPDFAAKLGYNILSTEYKDSEPHPSDKQYIAILGKAALQGGEVRLGSRNGLEADVLDPQSGKSVRLFGTHFDDRNPTKRRFMARMLAHKFSPDNAVVVMGDINDMHRQSGRARFFRSWPVRALAHIAPLKRMRSLGTRLTGMASGTALEVLKRAGLTDADPKRKPTMMMGPIPIAQLDHILYTEGKVSVSNFQRHRLAGSDHQAVSATVSAK